MKNLGEAKLAELAVRAAEAESGDVSVITGKPVKSLDLDTIGARHDAYERECFRHGLWEPTQEEYAELRAHEDRGELLDEVERLRAVVAVARNYPRNSGSIRAPSYTDLMTWMTRVAAAVDEYERTALDGGG